MSQDFHGDVGQVAARNIINRGGNTHLELNIHGNNYGSITVGGGGGSGGGSNESGRPIHQWSVPELKEALARYRSQWWSGFRGYWINPPCLLTLTLASAMAGSLFAGILPIRDPHSMWAIVAPCALVMLGLGYWLTRIRRIEGRVMAESQAAIDFIRTELRKRR
ncbi:MULTISPECIES: hypothetical protein [unclassified Pseudomonas]|uniref:hypothetical protein n=1 Tax=unclassified Pseudomonas TaxID=196821 RepID=UPI0024470CF8|nr:MULTISPECIES: hypothetical protein [unclassified Pseudomonas]MDH0894379.1 hypothetical protein [Pseudomonas sp. GD03875]MDH1063326.1 hypothetical protein [Pseudomonas sp. GD03985]